MKEAIKFLDSKAAEYGNEIKGTITDRHVFERNCRSKYIYDILTQNVRLLAEYTENIGKPAYKYKRTFHYSFVPDPEDSFRSPVESEPVEFTNELFEVFVKDYLEFSIRYRTDELINQNPQNRSTDDFANLIHLWTIGGKQELIKIYKEALEISGK